ncbi:MAG: tetratricopeptide repeat protein [Candidatus Obscuribacterales bacterium]
MDSSWLANWPLAAGAALTLLAIIFWQANSRQGSVSPAQIQSSLSGAALARKNGDHEQAVMLYERALSLIEGQSPVDKSYLSACLVSYAESLDRTGSIKEARDVRTRLMSLWNSALEEKDIDLMTEVDYLCTSAEFGSATRDVADYYERLLAFREKAYSHKSDIFINTVVIYAGLMRRLGEKEIADDLEAHAEKLRKGGPREFVIPGEASGEEPS